MAVTTQYSNEYADQFVSGSLAPVYPTEVRGTMCYDYFTTAQSGAGDATSSFAVVKLPPGRVRVYLAKCGLYANWTTASATLDLGWDAYSDLNGDAVAADVDGLIDGISVESAGVIGFEELTASAGAGATAANAYTKVFESQGGVVLRLSSTDTAIADADSANGWIAFVAC